MRAILACALLLTTMNAAYAADRRVDPPAPPAATSPAASESAALGRLFYTPAQRAALDEMRRRPQRVAQDEKTPLPSAPEYVTLNGVIQRSDGATTVWLNDKQVRGRESDDGLQIARTRRAATPSGVTVRIPQTGHVVDLKVGQQLDVNSGEVKERYRASPRPNAGTAAEAPVAPPVQDVPGSRDRRASREREALRELLREIESPASPGSSAAPAPPTTPR